MSTASSPDLFVAPDGSPRVVRGVCVYSGAPRLCELAARIGFETVWVEMEHGPADFAAAEAMCMAAEAGGGVATVRVPDGQRCHILRALEIGARILIVPMVNSADQAARIVEHGKFSPLGRRGFNTRSRGMRYGLAPPGEAFIAANRSTYLFAQVETQEAIKALDAICGIEGLDGIFVGPGDLSLSIGAGGSLTHDRLIRVVTDCIRRARAAGRHAGILVAPGPLLEAALAAGADLVFAGGDVTDLVGAWRRLLDALATGGTTA